MNTNTPSSTLIDRAIGYLAPGWAAKRLAARAALAEMQNLYDGANPGRLDTYWPASRGERGMNSALNTWRLTRLRDRARHLVQNNVLAAGMLDRAVENVIGHGMRLQATTDDEEFNEQAEALWNDWLDDADITGKRSGAELQRTFYYHYLLDGDVGCGLVSRGTDCFLQGYEGDLITTLNGGNKPGENVVDGIEHDDDNRPTGFYVTPFNDFGVQTAEQYVRARDFVFLARLRRLTQVRGEPCFAQTFQLFDQIEGYKEAVIIAARVAACQGLVIKRLGATTALNGMQQQQDGQRLQKMEPGMAWYLQPGEDIQTISPSQPTQSFPDFIAALLRFAGLTLGLPLELTLLDFSRTNYSSARASLLQAYRSFRTQQQSFCDHFMSRVYRWRLSKWVKNGQLKVPAALMGDPSSGLSPSWWSHSWIAPGWQWVDPQREIEAALIAIDAGLDTVTGVLQQQGKNPEDIIAARKRELDKFKLLGLEFSKSNMTRDAVVTPTGTGKRPNGTESEEDGGDGNTSDGGNDDNGDRAPAGRRGKND